jgi:hypothetical protein
VAAQRRLTAHADRFRALSPGDVLVIDRVERPTEN